MGILRRFAGWRPERDRGIRLEGQDSWEVSATDDVEAFLRALPQIAPSGAMVYFEGTGERHVADYLGRVAVPPLAHVARGTIWPRQGQYHVPLTRERMEALAEFLESNPAGYFCSHLHVYHEGKVLLQWYDAFSDPMQLTRDVPEETVRMFAAALGVTYERTLAG